MTPTVPTRSYVVCATPRSGSALLCEALKSTGVAGRPEEYLWRDDEPVWRTRWNAGEGGDYVRAMLREGTTPNGVFGVKVMWGYFHEAVARLRDVTETSGPEADVIADALPDARYVFVSRRDKVAQAVSFHRAIVTGAWTWRDARGFPTPPEDAFDVRAIEALHRELLEHEAAWLGFFADARAEPLRVEYERLVEDREAAIRRVLEYLEVAAPDCLDVSVPIKRQADRLSEEWIRRYLASRA